MKISISSNVAEGVGSGAQITSATGARGTARLGRGPQRGVALVVTLILLSVITFLAVAFLFLSRRERGAVTTTLAQANARRATEAATERAIAETIAEIIASRNQFNYDLRVSRNYINPAGFDPSLGVGQGTYNTANVNYDYLTTGGQLNADQLAQNIANLYYSPRPPVFVSTNPGSPLDFRYYLDLNRNGRYETNGWLPVLTGIPGTPYFDTNGIPTSTFDPANVLMQNFVGDPEWVGVLQRPIQLPLPQIHSAQNLFVSRFAYVVVPTGKTLDVNRIHNQSRQANQAPNAAGEGFSRNIGVGTYEINGASFLADLNTNIWSYSYQVNGPFNTGTAFEDAWSWLRYRYDAANNVGTRSIGEVLPAGVNILRTDPVDDFGFGTLMTGINLPNTAPDDSPVDRTANNWHWPGDENPNHYFTTQDVFDPAKVSGAFVNRLLTPGILGASSYDRYTYYRMLEQLGTDSAPEIPDKMHLNYVNVDAAGKTIENAQTNFVDWPPVQFFTNAVDRILRATFANAADNALVFGVSNVISYTNIPVMVSNRFVYTAALHRCLQVAANLYDSTVTRVDGTLTNYPTVLRPSFRREKNPLNPAMDDIYIRGFQEVGPVSGFNDPQFVRPLDLNDSADVAVAGLAPDQNIYGVPWVIGARKGFPNFNEFALQSISQMSRKLQIRKLTPGTSSFVKTNQMFIVGISNTFAFELWNSYAANYNRDSQVLVANDVTMSLNYTNDPQFDLKGGVGGFRTNYAASVVIPGATTPWYGYGGDIGSPARASFVVPMNTNINFLPDSIYRTASGNTVFTTNILVGLNLVRGFEESGKFHLPLFNFSSTNRIRSILIDSATGRVLDYVQLNGLDGVRNLTSETTDATTGIDFLDGASGGTRSEAIFWQTNRVGGATVFAPTMGVKNQIDASLGNIDVPDWRSIGTGAAAGQTKEKEIDGFRQFMGLARKYPSAGAIEPNTNTIMQVPFTPTRRTSQYLTWQANDPLVHYTAGDLTTIGQGTGIKREQPNGIVKPLPNIGQLNLRFEPWGGNPASSSDTAASSLSPYNLAAKDPGVYTPDDWAFSTNKFPTIGFLGRVHRGTPWQTIYMKSDLVNLGEWSKWTGNTNLLDAQYTLPVVDRVLFDLFTTAVDQNTTRGQLNVNQTGLASWSALLGGVIGLTNTSTDAELEGYPPVAKLAPYVIDPAGISGGDYSPLGIIHKGITDTRNSSQFKGYFRNSGDILAVPQLTVASPLLNTNSLQQLRRGINDAAYERIPQMIMGLLRGNDQPRFAIYAYGQALAPARASRYTQAGPLFNLCTNYQITAEFATRTVVRIEGAPSAPRAVIESFNVLGPE